MWWEWGLGKYLWHGRQWEVKGYSTSPRLWICHKTRTYHSKRHTSLNWETITEGVRKELPFPCLSTELLWNLLWKVCQCLESNGQCGLYSKPEEVSLGEESSAVRQHDEVKGQQRGAVDVGWLRTGTIEVVRSAPDRQSQVKVAFCLGTSGWFWKENTGLIFLFTFWSSHSS